jgi:CMP-N-acetylneuraminic acid synthetase
MILGVIPARGGSKGIPRKNIKQINGKPLIYWTIARARQSKLLDNFIVSTEDWEIAEISQKYGANVDLRPPYLADDDSKTIDVLKEITNRYPATTIVLLQPTSPIRRDNLIDLCLRRYFNTDADSLATGYWCKKIEYGPEINKNPRRQDIEGFFTADGNIFITDADLIRRGKLVGDNFQRFESLPPEQVDIDDEFDFWMAEQILKSYEM